MKLARFVLVLGLVVVAPFAMADEKAKQEATAAADAEKAMMDAWMKASTPGDPHKALDQFVGTWDVKTKAWMAPGAPPMESSGISENKWVLGGRYVEQKFEGTFMGMPFHGIGYTGYDNIRKTYFGSWMDNMSTASMTSTGTTDGKTFTFEGSMDDPMTGKPQKIKEKISIQSADQHTLEMWGPAPDGTMFKNMEIVYTRKK